MYKARRYFEKWVERFLEIDVETWKATVRDIYLEFAEETHAIAQVRGLVTHKDIMNVVNEQNRKWNHLRRIFIRELGFTVLPKNYFINNF